LVLERDGRLAGIGGIPTTALSDPVLNDLCDAFGSSSPWRWNIFGNRASVTHLIDMLPHFYHEILAENSRAIQRARLSFHTGPGSHFSRSSLTGPGSHFIWWIVVRENLAEADGVRLQLGHVEVVNFQPLDIGTNLFDLDDIAGALQEQVTGAEVSYVGVRRTSGSDV